MREQPTRALIAYLMMLVLSCTSSAIAQDGQNVTTFEDLVAMMERIKVGHQANAEQKFVLIPTEHEGFKSAQVIRWAAQDGVVHFIQVIPLSVPEEQLSAMESAIVRLNHGFPVPGLGMNHESKNTLYFRMTVPLVPRGALTEQEVQDYFGYCLKQAIQFLPTLSEVIDGTVEPKDVMNAHRMRLQAAMGPFGYWKKSAAGSEWILSINPNGEVTLKRDGEVVVDSMIKVDGNRMTFTDVTGALAVPDEGTYEFAVTEGKLSFQVVDDPSEGRQQVLTGDSWSR